MVLETVKETIRKHNLLEKKDKVLIAFSGGLDSTALVAVFLELQKVWFLDLFLGHFNHRLRPGAGEDERFVRKFAQEHALPLFVASEDVRSFAKKYRLNLEEAGRMLRYEFLTKTAREIGGAKIATGHTLDDQAETFFLRLMRGSGLKGLGSISPVVEGRIIRPLLSVEKKDIANYVKKKGWEFREDESNLDRRFARNKVRLDLIPYIQQNFEPNIIRRIGKIVSILQEEEKLLDKWASHETKKAVLYEEGEVRLDLNSVLGLPQGLARRVVREFIRKLKGDLRGITFEGVDSLLNLEEGKSFHLTDKLLLKRENSLVFLRSELPDPMAYSYEWDGSSPLILEELSLMVKAERVKRPKSFVFDDNTKAYLDGKAISFPLQVRNRQEGDRYRPLGAPGQKKLKEIMRAKSLPLIEREKKPVFLSTDEIVWVLGLPVAEKFKISDKTKEVLVITISQKQSKIYDKKTIQKTETSTG
ncbi:MAG: tRNA lysidine(34) synthetase TilS [Candidatus Aminicenantes bacterium]|nr:MAG: tRNA lysidine(34) synthetase TilS [Candidatus Aminicenantes bacterium]